VSLRCVCVCVCERERKRERESERACVVYLYPLYLSVYVYAVGARSLFCCHEVSGCTGHVPCVMLPCRMWRRLTPRCGMDSTSCGRS
jgi:hypothetical protein